MQTTIKLRSGGSLIVQPSATRQNVQLTLKPVVGPSLSVLVANADWGVVAQAGEVVAHQNALDIAIAAGEEYERAGLTRATASESWPPL